MSDWGDGGEPRRNPAVTALMILLGLPLLLPGVCSYFFIRTGPHNSIATMGFVISFGGLALIVFGIRRLILSPAPTAVSETSKLLLLLGLLALLALLALAGFYFVEQLSHVRLRN
jgi:hypothetical protein